MNYQKIYDQLIEKRRQQPLIKKSRKDKDYQYCEKHHIIPRCFGGDDSKANLVNLTAREHYIAHKLLEKIYKEEYGENSKEHEKMICALWRFIYSNETNSIINAKEYEKLKIKFGKIQSFRVSGSKNGMYGRKGKDSLTYGISPFKNFSEERMNEYKLKQSISHKGKPAWNKGKHIHYNYTDEQRKRMSERSTGQNNPMYGHSVIEYMTDEKIKEWKENISKKSKGRKHMYHPDLLINVFIKNEDIQKYLDMGYVYGQVNKNSKNIV